MNKCPKIGDRVSYTPDEPVTVGPCTGIVTAIYETTAYDDDLLEEAYAIEDDKQAYYAALRRASRGLRPESEWHVAVRVDVKPEKWCYGESDSFAPEVKRLQRIKRK